jgi:hypothetical protein
LGKERDGIKEAIRPKMKFNTKGVGYSDEEGFKWWEHVYNKAADNISVQKNVQTF